MRNLNSSYRPRPKTPYVELVLRLEDSSPWHLTVSAGVERFIGYYPRLDGFDTGGPLVSFGVTKPA